MGRKQKANYEKIYQDYINGKPISESCKEDTANINNMYHWMKRYSKSLSENKTYKYMGEGLDFNHDYLSNGINDENKAYFLGMMLADGWIQDNRIGLKLKKEDSYLCKKLLRLFSNNRKLHESKETGGFNIVSKKTVEKLKECGFNYNKTYNFFNFPSIEKSLNRHFIRGYFDGDGSISFKKSRRNQIQVYICSLDSNFLNQVKNILTDVNITSNIYLEKRNGKELKLPSGKISSDFKDMYRLTVKGHENLLKFYNYLYHECSIKLERKYQIFNEYYTNTVLILENKNSNTVQRIDNEPFINFLTELNFRKIFHNSKDRKKYISKTELKKYLDDGLSLVKIAKITNISRGIIGKFKKEYNLSKSAQQPIIK